jgi:zinc transporter ZupT
LQFLANLRLAHRWAILIVTATVTPLGIAIATGISESLEENIMSLNLAQGIIFSMSAGSFLFIALMELLPSSLSDGRLPFLKTALFTGGFLLMAILGAYV